MGHHHDEDDDYEEEHEHSHSHGGGFVSGALLGGLVGVAVGLLLAPAAGQDTRRKIRDSALSARDQALGAAEEARAKAEDLQNTGRELFEDNKRRIVRTAEAVKQSAQEAWTAESEKANSGSAQLPRVESAAGGAQRPSGSAARS